MLADLEFVQFHPTVLWLGKGAQGQQPLISEAVRGEGAVLLDADGRRFMPEVHPMAELAPRDVVAKAIVRQMGATGADHVYLDARDLGREFLARRFPGILESLAEHGLDLAEDLIPVAPAQHYHSGGIVTGPDGRSSLDGLYAVGEVSCTGVHGANRLASNSLLEGLVFAHRIADDIARRHAADLLPRVEPDDEVGAGGTAALRATSRVRIQRAATSGPGVIRTAVGLAAAAERLESLLGSARLTPSDPPPSTAEWETTNLHQVAAALTAAAALRAETRGGHYREDRPEADDAWRGRLVSSLGDDGRLVTRFVPLNQGPNPGGQPELPAPNDASSGRIGSTKQVTPT
jgi:L-aspartate oxidase